MILRFMSYTPPVNTCHSTCRWLETHKARKTLKIVDLIGLRHNRTRVVDFKNRWQSRCFVEPLKTFFSN